MEGQYRLIAFVLYGGGLRVMEALQLRVKDLQFDYRQIVVRGGRGANAVQSPLDSRGAGDRRRDWWKRSLQSG